MTASVGVNFMSVIHKKSMGISPAMPDLCKMPTPAGPIPVPYPNISMSVDTDKPSKKVKCEGNPVCVKGSTFKMSMGDEAGSSGGVMSNKIKGKTEFLLFSMNVQFDGKNVHKAFDITLHNDKNTPPFPVIQPPVI
ncbi:Uncharacterised protein [BD1-7 clade bacterium]|uniref:Tox-PAAR-like domain-containing protein n=1 Tax=BD1-7 clade bacterium TaxID=2029982 RepID=A0A5S9NWQ6_9GAMM|nr:Uncharacterised protein [BD1-7 clade bacterium]CAA0095724.1 Uncharacterised protein [BD1-7 clade bacterium]